MNVLRRISGFAIALTVSTAAYAVAGAWDHAANVKDAAKRLAVLHKREGSSGVIKFLDACYRTHMLASDYTQGLESCMAQDYMHSKILAVIYARVPEAERAKLKAPSPEQIADSMGRRFVAAFSQYKVPVADAEDFKTLVDKHGFPVFLKAVMPKAAPGDDSAGKTAKDEKK